MTSLVSGFIAALIGGSFTGLPGLINKSLMGAKASGFSWFQYIPGFGEGGEVAHALGLHDAHAALAIPASWAIVLIILGLAVVARMGLEAAKKQGEITQYIPDTGLTARNIFEVIIAWQYSLVESSMGAKEAKNFFPLIGTLFFYILFSNLAGFIPGFTPPTDNISHNFAMAIVVFLVFNYAGLSRQGFGYIKHLAGPILVLAPVFLVLETVSLVIRPISLSIRLAVNIFVDHLLQQIARGLGDTFLGVVGAVLLPVPLYFLGLLVCVVQAFIFALLTNIYISLSVAHADHGSDHGSDNGAHGGHAGGHHH